MLECRLRDYASIAKMGSCENVSMLRKEFKATFAICIKIRFMELTFSAIKRNFRESEVKFAMFLNRSITNDFVQNWQSEHYIFFNNKVMSKDT